MLSNSKDMVYCMNCKTVGSYSQHAHSKLKGMARVEPNQLIEDLNLTLTSQSKDMKEKLARIS